jgi:hypothetical protein
MLNEPFMKRLQLKVEVGDMGEVFPDPPFFPVIYVWP